MGAGGAPQTATANTITLKGSAQIVSEFFDFAVNRCAGSAPPRPPLPPSAVSGASLQGCGG